MWRGRNEGRKERWKEGRREGEKEERRGRNKKEKERGWKKERKANQALIYNLGEEYINLKWNKSRYLPELETEKENM